MRMTRTMIDLAVHKPFELLGREDALQFVGNLLQSVEVLGTGTTDDAQIGIFEVHTVKRIQHGAIGQTQFAGEHVSLLTGNLLRSALRLTFFRFLGIRQTDRSKNNERNK